jgi:hypothetical protein
VIKIEASNYSRSNHANPIRIDLKHRFVVDRHPSNKLRADVAIVRPRGRVLRVVARIQRLGARAGNREFAASDIALVGELEQRALRASETVKLRQRELDEWRLGRERGFIGAARDRGNAQKEGRDDGER